MNFFEDLLTSYNLLRKRKLHIQINEGKDESKGLTWANLLKMDMTPGSQAQKAFEEVTTILETLFTGSKPGSMGDKVGAVNLPGAYTDLVDALQITQPTVEENDTTANGNGKSKEGGESKPVNTESCGGPVYAFKLSRNAIIQGENPKSGKTPCSTTGTFKQDFTNAVLRIVWKGKAAEGLEAEGIGANETPEQQEFTDSTVGSELINIYSSEDYKDDDTTLKSLLAIHTLMSRNAELWGDFGDIKDDHSLFAVVAKTIRRGESEGIKLGTLGNLSLESSIATKDEVGGAVSNLLDLIPKLTSPISDEDGNPKYDNLKILQNNLTLVKDEKGKTLLFIKTGFNDLGIQLDGGLHKDLIEVVTKHNQLVEKLSDDAANELIIPTSDREFIRDRSTEGDLSTKYITNVSEQVDTILLLMHLGRHKEAMGVFKDLDKKYGDNIARCLHISEAVTTGKFAGTQDAEAWLAANQTVTATSPNFVGFLRQVSVLRQKTIDESGAIGCFRCGDVVDAGKEGFKSDQVLIFPSTAKGKKDADKYFKGASKSVSLGELSDLLNISVDKMKKQWGLDPSYDDNTQVNAAWESLKYYTSAGVTLGSVRSLSNTVKETIKQLTGKGGGVNQDWLTSLREAVRIPLKKGGDRALSKVEVGGVRDVLTEISEGLDKIELLTNPDLKSPTLDGDQIRSELIAAVGPMGPQRPTDVRVPSDDIVNDWTENTRHQQVYDLNKKYILSKLRQGMELGEESHRHTLAYLMARGTIDRDDALDLMVNPGKAGEEGAVESTKRNVTVKKEMRRFMGAPTTQAALEECEFKENGFSIGGLSYKQATSAAIGKKKHKGEVQAGGEVSLTSRKGSREDSSTQYSSKELMNKLLEVQELMFSHLIKE